MSLADDSRVVIYDRDMFIVQAPGHRSVQIVNSLIGPTRRGRSRCGTCPSRCRWRCSLPEWIPPKSITGSLSGGRRRFRIFIRTTTKLRPRFSSEQVRLGVTQYGSTSLSRKKFGRKTFGPTQSVFVRKCCDHIIVDAIGSYMTNQGILKR